MMPRNTEFDIANLATIVSTDADKEIPHDLAKTIRPESFAKAQGGLPVQLLA